MATLDSRAASSSVASGAVSGRREIYARLREHGAEIRACGVRRLGLFGSFARSEQSAASDVDLLVEFDAETKTFDNFMRLAELLDDLLRRRVELVTPESLSPYLAPKILAEVRDVPLGA